MDKAKLFEQNCSRAFRELKELELFLSIIGTFIDKLSMIEIPPELFDICEKSAENLRDYVICLKNGIETK